MGKETAEESSSTNKEKQKQDTSTQKVSVKITAKNPLFEVEINTKTTISDIPKIIDSIVEKIEKAKKFSPQQIDIIPKSPPPRAEVESTEDPLSLFATQIEVNVDELKESKLLSIKNQTAQILKPTALSPSESCYLLLAAYEYALGRSSLSYEEWKEICDASKIKSKTPFYKMANNAKDYGHINKKSYMSSKEIILEPKGLEIVKKVVSKYISKD